MAGLSEIVALEPDFLVVAKPPGLLSHPTRPDGAPSLLGWLQREFPGEFVALVNRLDRETSGTVLVARSAAAASRLGAMTMRREIVKDYLALVDGRMTEPHGTIDAPLGRLGISADNAVWVRQGVVAPDDAAGRRSFPARTEFRVLATGEDVSLLRLRAHTGRLHQLRVHLAQAGHPVLGDKIYGPDAGLYLRFIEHGWTDEHEQRLALRRHALHAWRMEFAWDGATRIFQARVPDDMRELGERCGLPMPD